MSQATSEELIERYRGKFDGRLEFGRKPALLLIDVVLAYIEISSPLYVGSDAAFESMIRLVDEARCAGIPVIFTNVVYQAAGADGGYFYRKVPALKLFDAGSALAAFSPRLQPRANEMVVTKQYASAFFGTSLAATLNAQGVDTVCLAGFSTSGCIRASALDALQNGFIPFVVADACGDFHAAPHDANLFDLQSKYAEVVEEAVARTLIRQGTPP